MRLLLDHYGLGDIIMSRPKGSKNKTNIKEVTKSLEEDTNEVNYIKKSKIIKNCSICKKAIPINGRKVNLSYLSGICQYHREVIDNLELCDECAFKFSKYIDEYLIKQGAPKRINI